MIHLGAGWRWEAGGGKMDGDRWQAGYGWKAKICCLVAKVGSDEKGWNWRENCRLLRGCPDLLKTGGRGGAGDIPSRESRRRLVWSRSQGRGKGREAGAAHQKYTAWPGWLGHTAITFTITVYSRLKREISLERMTFFTTVHKILFLYALSAFNKLFKLRACKKCAHKELTQSQSSYWLKY